MILRVFRRIIVLRYQAANMSYIEIIALQAKLIPQAACLLTMAFSDNPLYLAVFNGIESEKTERNLRTFFSIMLDTNMAYRTISAIRCDNELAGVSITKSPRSSPLSHRSNLLFAIKFNLLIGPQYAWRLFLCASHIVKRHITEKHCELFILGIAPSFQGKGLGSKLVRKLSEHADHEGVPCFLETSNFENIDFYKNLGYSLIGEDCISKLGNLKLYYMIRPSLGKRSDNNTTLIEPKLD